ncbi:MAG TPA: type I-B CRISPR-associated protein Cas7/Cst2/DevR [Candidatus Nitrosotenuis sp.]|nr:type I-B CRISPR-associated protein Cas7/Cst2/DevR [Candidatus Nitrosotenuis sp.]
MSNKDVSKNVLGFVLIDAPHSALNMGQADTNEADENKIPVKFIRRGRDIYPYVSAQAWRYWWRETLETKFKWQMSPTKREKKIVYTSANPFVFPDDDVFGYMRAMSEAKGGTLTRLSPLKTSPLISVFPQSPTEDFGVMSRDEGNPVPHVHQFYSTVLKGIFSLDLTSVGLFYEVNRTGFKNLDEKYVATAEIEKAIKDIEAYKVDNLGWRIPKNVREQRAADTISALSYLFGGAKQTLHLTDVTPKFIILSIIKGGNHIFMNITSKDSNTIINVNALEAVISDYKDELISDIFIGRQVGFLDNLEPTLSEFKMRINEKKKIHLLSPKQAIEEFIKVIADHLD